jgi:2-keto-4-pentenoate hydratase
MGERLAEGDRVITGSIVQVPIQRGDEVAADLGALGSVRLTVV